MFNKSSAGSDVQSPGKAAVPELRGQPDVTGGVPVSGKNRGTLRGRARIGAVRSRMVSPANRGNVLPQIGLPRTPPDGLPPPKAVKPWCPFYVELRRMRVGATVVVLVSGAITTVAA